MGPFESGLREHYNAVRARIQAAAPVDDTATAVRRRRIIKPKPKPELLWTAQAFWFCTGPHFHLGALPSGVVRVISIQRAACAHFKVTLPELLGKMRVKTVVYPRHVAIYVATKMCRMSLPELGRRFGGRDHTTMLHARNRIETLYGADERVRNDVDALMEWVR